MYNFISNLNDCNSNQNSHISTPVYYPSYFYANSFQGQHFSPLSMNNISSVSSGYSSANTSYIQSPFINPNCNQVYYNSVSVPVYQQEESPLKNDNKKASKKRQREEVDQENKTYTLSKTDLLIQQVFEPVNPSKKTKRVIKKKSEQLTEITDTVTCNFCEFDYDDFDLEYFNDDSNNLSNNSLSNCEKKKRVLSRTQRQQANLRERKRMHIMNDAFVYLRQVLPMSCGRKRRKMSRLDIVMGAVEYISYLQMLLESDSPYEINFEAYQNSLYFSS
jgi:hypothetical protein